MASQKYSLSKKLATKKHPLHWAPVSTICFGETSWSADLLDLRQTAGSQTTAKNIHQTSSLSKWKRPKLQWSGDASTHYWRCHFCSPHFSHRPHQTESLRLAVLRSSDSPSSITTISSPIITKTPHATASSWPICYTNIRTAPQKISLLFWETRRRTENPNLYAVWWPLTQKQKPYVAIIF